MEITGRIKKINSTQTRGANNFRTRSMWIVTNDKYPQTLQVEFTQDKVNLLNSFTEGSFVRTAINLRGREWENPKTNEVKVFNTIEGWKLEDDVEQVTASQQSPDRNEKVYENNNPF
jgi:hypothetical protein